jgi:hypothetical protein
MRIDAGNALLRRGAGGVSDHGDSAACDQNGKQPNRATDALKSHLNLRGFDR